MMDTARTKPKVLIVDDQENNLTVLQLILEPLDVEVVVASSGEEALRILLHHEVAVIVLDVRMPGMDGFETAQYVKRRERSRHVPIIFLTAMGNDREQALSGYEAGAVDFIEKPVEPLVLCAKVAAFAELHEARLEVARQSELLREAAAREAARELEAVREQGERQYRDLAEAMPTMVFALDADGEVVYHNLLWETYLGSFAVGDLSSDDSEGWKMVHPADRASTQRRWFDALASPDDLPDDRLDLDVRLRRHDGVWLWHDLSCRARRDADGVVAGWVGTATQVDTQRRNEHGQRVLAETGVVLAGSSQLDDAMIRVATLAVPEIADWCSIDVLDGLGRPRRVALRADGGLDTQDVERLAEALSLERDDSAVQRLFTPDAPQRILLDAAGVEVDVETGQPMAVLMPLVIRGERLGVVTVAVGAPGRQLGDPELGFTRSLATRLASAVDASRLFRRAEERAQASQVLDAIADGVVLVDRDGLVRLWNPAAAAITGVSAADAVGRRPNEVLADWDAMVERVPTIERSGNMRVGVTLPLTSANGRDLWLSVTAVRFALGVAYAFRDLTEERAVDRMKSDFVATVSHELRTPLASIYGAAVTLQREDLDLSDEIHEQMLDIIAQQSQQLAGIVEAVLTASRLDAGESSTFVEALDATILIKDVVEVARRRTNQHELVLEADDGLPQVSADPGQLRQVFDNLIENAIKYSPDGGRIDVRVRAQGGMVAYELTDDGVGISPNEQVRIFDKFYRVDAAMSQGIGGTGLGLFIVRELVRQMAGRIDVRSDPGSGSTFTVQLPAVTVGRVAT